MPFEPTILFPGILAESAARLARDAASRHPDVPVATLTAEMGWNAVLIPEEHGGAGGDFTDLASIIESLALQAVDLPVVTRCGIVPALLNALSDNDVARTWLAASAEGRAVIELGGPLDDAQSVQPLIARGGPSAWRLTGATAALTLTDDCTHVLVVGRTNTDHCPLLACVASDSLRAAAASFVSMDGRRVSVCHLDDVPISADEMLALGTDAERAIQTGWNMAVAATATDTVSGMGAALARTVDYLLERQQFGQPLSQFQALRHEVARLYIHYELARNLLQASLQDWNPTDPDNSHAGAFDLLGLCVGQDAIAFAESVIQLHGGMGMTRETPAARLATRLMANTLRFGDPLTHQHNLNQLRDGMPV